jgi:RND family efflux transporter MFP subunit
MAVIIGGIIFYIRNKKPVVVYTTADVERINLARTVSSTGTINPNEQIDLTFKTTGILENINVDLGDSVEKGQTLATIDAGTLLSQLRQAQEQLTYQKEILNNMKKHTSTYKYEQREAQKALMNQAQAGIDIILDQLENVNIISPIDGIVIKRNADPGETVVLNLNSPVLTVAPKGDMIIESNIPESDVAKLQIGQKAKVTFDALTSDDIFDAVVWKIDPAATVIQDVVYYRIKLQLSNLDECLKVGMSANIDIHTAQADDVVTIPSRAIQTESDEKYAQVLNVDGVTVNKVKIQTGLEGDEGMVEVKSGLKEGEKVITYQEVK